MMPHKQHRYARPCLEIEYDQEALLNIACCGFVPAVFRVCTIDPQARLSISFQRVRQPQADDTASDVYEVHPSSGLYLVPQPFSCRDYREYHATFLARAHAQETGTIHLQMESAAGTSLLDVSFRFDPRQDRPIFTAAKGRVQALRFLPALRSTEARTALNGRYPASAGGKVLPVSDPLATQMRSLFSFDA